MSPRPKRIRVLKEPPSFKGFTPIGGEHDQKSAIILHFEEYEALILSDYESLNQEDAAKKLQVSRPTFTRIYGAARKKVATALARNLSLIVEGGQVEFDTVWYECSHCSCVFKSGNETTEQCPVCNSTAILPVQEARKFGNNKSEKTSSVKQEMCICPKCDYEIPHQLGTPCSSILCPNCDIRMLRKGSNRHLFVLKKRQNS
ncbi:MAG: DUF134 domain-containing protein [Bacteroidales bacterium]|nr:DUF134 domain-containing protein [Bacteroidales bacterium]